MEEWLGREEMAVPAPVSFFVFKAVKNQYVLP